MSSTTTNLGLVKMASGETIGQWSDANNGSGQNLDKIDTAIGTLNSQIGADTKWISVPASGATTTTMSSRGLWLFYRVYRPTIVFIRTNGNVELVVGESQDLTFSLSGSTLTITNPATWAVNCWVLG